MPNQVVSLNAAVSPYEADLAQISQRQRLAELLQQQSMQPTERFSYNGIEAHTPATANLAKILQGVTAVYGQKKSIDDQRALSQKAQSDASDWITKLTQGVPSTPEVPGSVAATPADVSDREQGMAMGSGAQPMTPGQPIPTAGGQGEGANVGSAPTPAMTPQQKMALLLQGVQNPLTAQAAQSMIANQQSLESQKALQMASFGQQKDLQQGSFAQQKDIQAQQERFTADQAAKGQEFQRSMGTPIMVPDATSPTGFKYVRPEQAVGQPGYNPNAMFGPPGAVGTGGGPQVSGDEFLKTLAPQAADTVKGIAEGRIPISPQMVRTPQGMQLLGAVNQYDPTFDATNYQARASQRKNYEGGGKQYQEMQAINTVAGHLGDLMQTADRLNNFNDLGPLNSTANAALGVYRSATQDPRINDFNTAVHAVTDELGKAYKGGVVSEGEVKQWQSEINSQNTPEQLKTVVGRLNSLLSSKREALERGYKQTMGKATLPADFSATNDHTKSIFDRVDQWSSGEKAPASAAAPGVRVVDW